MQAHGQLPTGAQPAPEVRPLGTSEDYAQCVELQRDTWGRDFAEIVPPALLQVSQKVGGVAAGAFDEGDRLIGFVYGVSGIKRGRLSHWSHMLAVRPEWSGVGVGTRLKLHQRQTLLGLGIGVAYWTFDPLVARNAHLNLNRLGAGIIEYTPNMYGDTGSDLHSGLGTDRFLVAWELDAPQVERALAGTLPTTAPLTSELQAIQLDDEGTPTIPTDIELPETDPVLIAVPADIHAVKTESPELAWRWRELTRRALQWYLARQYRVQGFIRTADSRVCHYLLSTRQRGEV